MEQDDHEVETELIGNITSCNEIEGDDSNKLIPICFSYVNRSSSEVSKLTLAHDASPKQSSGVERENDAQTIDGWRR